MSFNKIFKNNKKELAKKQEEQAIRITSVIDEIQEVCKRRSVNYYEMMDILSNMQGQLNINLARILGDNFDKMTKYKELLTKHNIDIDGDKSKSQ